MIPVAGCSGRSPGRIFIRVHPCLSTSIRVRWRPSTLPRHGSSDRNARDHSTWINNGHSPDRNSRRTSAYLGVLGVKKSNAEDAEEERRGRRGRQVCRARSPGRIFIRVHPCLSTSIRVRWRPSTLPRQRFSGSNAGDHPTRMDTDKQRSGIADDGIKCRTLTNFPAYLGVLGVKKSNAEDAEEGRRGRRGRRVRRAMTGIFETNVPATRGRRGIPAATSSRPR